jgi:hypothetical protein
MNHMVQLEFSIIGLLFKIVSATILTTPSLWIAGRMMVGVKKARFSDSLWIVALGVVVESVIGVVVRSPFTPFVQLFVWLYLIKHYFDTDWLRAFVVSILTVVVFIIVTVAIATVIGLIGLTFLSFPSPAPYSRFR